MFSNSSINWCEYDYKYSNYIAEFWNTLTGLTLCITGIYLYHINKQQKHYILIWSNILLFIVGIGTILFHGTLIYLWQLFDEIPMLLLVIEYYKLLLDTSFVTRISIFNVNYLKMYCMLPIIICSYYVHPTLHVLMFQATIIIYITLILYTCYSINIYLNKLFYESHTFHYVENIINSNICVDTDNNDNTDIDDNTDDIINILKLKKLRKRIKHKNITGKNKIPYMNSTYTVDKNNSIHMFKIYLKHRTQLRAYSINGMGLLIFSIFIWNIDTHFCDKIEFLKLHAIWHVTTSIGIYYVNEIIKMYIILNKYI
jgi:hypothetical protein